MQTKHFLDGLEETIARIVSLILGLAFFGLYFGNKTPIFFDWYSLIGVLALFWLVYEAVAYLLFVVFSFFSARANKVENQISNPESMPSNSPEISQSEDPM